MHTEAPYTPRLCKYMAPPTKSRAVVNVSMEKNDKINVSKARYYTESKKELSGNVTAATLAYLQLW